MQSGSLERLQLIAEVVAGSALLESEFEIHERLVALERKLDLAGRTVRTLVDLINARHALRVEWYIVALILVEILLTLYAMWWP